MRYFLATLMLLAVTTAGMAESRVQQVVKHFNHLRIVYVRTPNGKQLPVITNLDKNGKPMGPKAGPAPDWTRVYQSERPAARTAGTRISPQDRQEPDMNREPKRTRQGIPIPPGRKPNRAINPYRPVNPFTDPTAIPSSH